MKLINKAVLGLAVVSSFIFIGCNNVEVAEKQVAKPMYDDSTIGLRKEDLLKENEVVPAETKYSNNFAGSGKKFERAFQDAPPMIPHDTTGMLPITVSNNQCVQCHAPEVASSMGALPYPESHMIDFRPKHNFDGKQFKKSIDNMKNEISVKKVSTLAGSRFNCSQCHAPQSEGQLVDNTFQPEFTTKDGAKKSHWSGSSLTEGLDTLME
ncbi:nitrate reductase [Halarcobacter mediterraneus]|uniref:Periplasmic nitrate reductase, electron transfer subunit n=1 Tax=Halarcobacter mediterraneus TaxID=2023153 RepID=A0A4Q1ASW8_9BACT|nr:nitrate reductase cytochrome c-type subunit [Halarcobacter mediterraneus]RXK12793.1 nitrate reductase [Halarcobacter mediterraneus]